MTPSPKDDALTVGLTMGKQLAFAYGDNDQYKMKMLAQRIDTAIDAERQRCREALHIGLGFAENPSCVGLMLGPEHITREQGIKIIKAALSSEALRDTATGGGNG